MNALPRSCWSCRTPSAPYRARMNGRTFRHARGPSSAAGPIRVDSARFLHQVPEHGPQLVVLRDHDRRRATGSRPASTASLTGALTCLPNACATATTVPGPTGPRGRGVVAHPLGHGHRRRPAGGLTTVHRLPDDGDPRGVAGHAEGVHLAQQTGQPVRPATRGRLPQDRPQHEQGGAGGRDDFAVLRQAQLLRRGSLHADNTKGDHRQPSFATTRRETLQRNGFRQQAEARNTTHTGRTVDSGTPGLLAVDSLAR